MVDASSSDHAIFRVKFQCILSMQGREKIICEKFHQATWLVSQIELQSSSKGDKAEDHVCWAEF